LTGQEPGSKISGPTDENVKKLLLTSAGFDNKNIEAKFLELVGKPPREIRTLFIPTAALSPEQKNFIPLCRQDLLNGGVRDGNIISYDLDRALESRELENYDAIYVCGGDTQHLLNRMNEFHFGEFLDPFLSRGGVYVGVSAGSIVMTANLNNNLGYVNCLLHVHKKTGHGAGLLNTENCPIIRLTDDQTIFVLGDDISVFEKNLCY
jgi:hypothetical protein